MDDRRGVKIEKTERGIAWTDAEGKRHEYERPIRTLHIQIQSLAAVLSLNRQTDGKALDKPLSPMLRGKGIIEDRSLAVIGFPDTSARAIDVSFVPLEGVNLERSQQGFKPVLLSYTEADWEIGNEAGWWVEIVLPISQFQLLDQSYESGRLIKLTVGLDMQDMFLDQPYYVPRDRLDWFIEPTEFGAKMANGEVATLNIETASLDLRQAAPPETDIEPVSEELEFKPVPQDTIGPALTILSQKVESVQKALRWIFWALVVLLFVVGGSRH